MSYVWGTPSQRRFAPWLQLGCLTILPSLSRSIYLSRLLANLGKLIYTRKIHKINITDFREDILNSDLIKHLHTTASLLSHQYFNTLRNILDKHAPIKRKMAPSHPDKGFVNSDILSAKRLKRNFERVWRSNNSTVNRSRYRAAVNRYNFLLQQSRHRHYSTVIAENNGNPKALWNTLRKSCTNP